MSDFQFKNKNILVISPEAWDYVYVSKHHYAMELARRGNNVYFLNPPNKATKNGISLTSVEGFSSLWIVNYSGLTPGIRFLPTPLMNFLERRFVYKLEKLAGVKFDVFWNFENSRFFHFGFAPREALKIYFQVDEDQNFHPLQAAKTADIALAINNYILNLIKAVQPNSFKIKHSLQEKIFQENKGLKADYSCYVPASPLRVMYVGNIDHTFILQDLFLEVVGANPDVQFEIVGPYTNKLAEQLKKMPNVYLHGKVEYHQIPALLLKSDILLLLYNDKFLGSPHKQMEYLSSGRVILTTLIEDFVDDNGLFCIAKTREEYLAKFKEIKYNISSFNTPSMMKKRIAYAFDHTYPQQLDRIEKLIQANT